MGTTGFNGREVAFSPSMTGRLGEGGTWSCAMLRVVHSWPGYRPGVVLLRTRQLQAEFRV